MIWNAVVLFVFGQVSFSLGFAAGAWWGKK